MDSSKKLYIAVAVLLVLGGGLYVQTQKQREEAKSYSYESKVAELPNVTVDEETRNAIDHVVLTRTPEKKADEGASDAGAKGPAEPQPETIVLRKKGEDEWELQQPVAYKANASNVKSLLDNLGKLKVSEQVSSGTDDYAKWGVTDDDAIHAVFKKGDEVVLDLYLGENGSRGQMVRVADKDGVYAIKGYSKYLYDRDADGWRDKSILKFEDKDVAKVTVENDNGKFNFERQGEKDWKATHDGKPIADFKASRVDDMVRAYKSLNASDFADGRPAAEVGLEKPAATVTIDMKEDAASYVVRVGDNSKGSSRWIQTNTSDQIFSVSSWTSDWAVADVSKWQDKKKDDATSDPSEK